MRRMSTAPGDLAQWANDAIQYAELKVKQCANNHRGDKSEGLDFPFLVSLALLVLKMIERSVSSAGENIPQACQHYSVCESYAASDSRWIFKLVDFPFASILEAGAAIQRKT